MLQAEAHVRDSPGKSRARRTNEVFIQRKTSARFGTGLGLAFSQDKPQRFFFVPDGNIYLGEVDTGRRAYRWNYKGLSAR